VSKMGVNDLRAATQAAKLVQNGDKLRASTRRGPIAGRKNETRAIRPIEKQ
jgi:hypothetical protein